MRSLYHHRFRQKKKIVGIIDQSRERISGVQQMAQNLLYRLIQPYGREACEIEPLFCCEIAFSLDEKVEHAF